VTSAAASKTVAIRAITANTRVAMCSVFEDPIWTKRTTVYNATNKPISGSIGLPFACATVGLHDPYRAKMLPRERRAFLAAFTAASLAAVLAKARRFWSAERKQGRARAHEKPFARCYLVVRNVSDSLRDEDMPRVERPEAQAHEPAAIATLLAETENSPHWPLIALAIAGGMRRGELAALRWADVDTAERVITVRGSFAEIPGRVWLKDTKGHEVRRVDLPELAMQALRRQGKLQAAEKLKSGGIYRDDGYVFTPEGGGHYIPNSLYKAFARSAKSASLRLTKLHAARHGYASWLIASGADLRPRHRGCGPRRRARDRRATRESERQPNGNRGVKRGVTRL
jgi:integrase